MIGLMVYSEQLNPASSSESLPQVADVMRDWLDCFAAVQDFFLPHVMCGTIATLLLVNACC